MNLQQMDKLHSEISLACTHEIFGIRELCMKTERRPRVRFSKNLRKNPKFSV